MSAGEFKQYDVIIIGAGAAGLMCALTAGQRGRRVLVLDHANKVGKKILMSGGGRCNFTHLYTTPENYFSANPHFCKSALSRYTPYDFLAMVEKHGVEYVDKEEGQLFCKHKAKDVLNMLLEECAQAGVKIRTRCSVLVINKNDHFELTTSDGQYSCESLVIATGGLSIPTLGASGFGYDVARQFGLNVLKTHATLVPFILNTKQLEQFSDLSGLSIDVAVICNDKSWKGAMLFTHRGISGPAILQISSYWNPGDEIEINLFPDINLVDFLIDKKNSHPKMEMKNVLAELVPKRFAKRICDIWNWHGSVNQFTENKFKDMAEQLHHWTIKPSGTEGYKTAEVTMGGVDTDELSSKTMESKKVPGLYFIGEVVDVTGQLGGYNFQWAWSSAWAAGQCV